MSVDITIQETVNEVDITVVQNVITVNVTRTTGSGGVESVTGTLVDNTDPLNPVINVPTMAQVLTVGDKEFQQIEVDRDFVLSDRLKYSVISGGMTMTLDDDLDLFPVNSLIQFVVEDNSDINATATLNFGAATNCYYLIQNITTLTLNVGDFCELKKAGAGTWILNVWNKGSGGGAVDSVNGQTGVVVLDASDVGAEPTKGSDDNYVTDAQLVIIGNTSGTNSGDNATNTTSNAYADAKVANDLTASTTVAPSKTAVNTALALKQNIPFEIQFKQTLPDEPPVILLGSLQGNRGATITPSHVYAGIYRLTASTDIFKDLKECYKRTDYFDVQILKINGFPVGISWYWYCVSDYILEIVVEDGLFGSPADELLTNNVLIKAEYKN